MVTEKFDILMHNICKSQLRTDHRNAKLKNMKCLEENFHDLGLCKDFYREDKQKKIGYKRKILMS
jgi:hypothetical protein